MEFSRRRAVRRLPNKGKSPISPLAVKIAVCAVIFITAAIAKQFDGTGTVKTAVANNIDSDAGYIEVFADIGRAFSENEDIKNIFGDAEENTTESSESASETTTDAVTEQTTQITTEPATTEQTGQTQTDTTSSPAVSDLNLQKLAYEMTGDEGVDDTPAELFQISPPDKVSLVTPVLGFASVLPLSGSVTSKFGYRDHPIDDDTKFHFGIDIGGNTGAKIAAFADGTVTRSTYDTINGNCLFIEHANGFTSVYCHMSKMLVKKGDKVKKGALIAYVGSTGAATGPHLHFELRYNGKTIDPTGYLNALKA